jgi:phenylalanyl-tRNA synthetase beta chain
MLQMLSRNKIHEYPQFFFEIGTVFAPEPLDVKETTHLGVTLAGDVDYTRIRQIVDGLLYAMGLTGTYAAADDARFLKGRCAKVSVNSVELGVLGEVSPRVLSLNALVVPVAAAELDIDALRKIVLK